MSKASEKASRKAESLKELRKLLRPGETIYTVLRHVSASGMSRRIDLYIMRRGHPRYISWHVANVLDYKIPDRKEGLVVGGCGMDMGFHLVHSLGYALWGDLAKNGTTKAATRLRERIRKASGHYLTQGGAPEPDCSKPGSEWFGAAGYALKHSWI